MILALIAMQAAGPIAANVERSLQPIPVTEAIALFQQVCFAPFPDQEAAYAAAGKAELGLTKQVKSGAEAMHPGDAWVSDRANVKYAKADWFPRDLPSPQCSVSVMVEGDPEHLAIEAEFSSALALPAGKGGKNKPRGQTQWDIPHSPDTWRIFLSTQSTANGKDVRMSLLNLRGTTKK